MLIPKVAMYANRGFRLCELNLIRYIALIEKREKASTTNTQNKRFEFPSSFKCAAEYDQVFCMKQKTVTVIGKSPCPADPKIAMTTSTIALKELRSDILKGTRATEQVEVQLALARGLISVSPLNIYPSRAFRPFSCPIELTHHFPCLLHLLGV